MILFQYNKYLQKLISNPYLRRVKSEVLENFNNLRSCLYSKVPSSFKNKTLWHFAELLIVPFILGGLTLSWNYRVDQQGTHNYRAELVRNYIDSITELILDQYHHGKIDKYPEISVEEVESFVRAKTVNTLQALKPPKHSLWHPGVWLENGMKLIILSPPEKTPKQNLINFLSEAGIGFLPPYKYEEYDSKLLIQNMCLIDKSNGVNYMISEEKDITFHDFLCKIELSGVVLNDLQLRAVIWEEANLHNAQMKGAKLEQADLQKANLNEVDLREAELIKANLKGAYIRGAKLQNAKLPLANLRGATLDRRVSKSRTNLENAQLLGVNLRGASLKGVNFKKAIMMPFCVTNKDQKQENFDCERTIATNLRNANLQGASLTGTNLEQANLRGAILLDANIRQAATLEGAIVDDKTQFPEFINKPDKFIQDEKMIKIHCDLNKDKRELERLQKFGLSDVDLRDACLTNANLSGVDLSRADLRGADMSNAHFEGANLNNTLYDNTTKLPSYFGSDKKERDEEAIIRRGMIKLVSGANLEGKDIRYVDLSDVDLSNAKLQGAKLSNIDFDDKTKWKDAEFDLHTELPFDRNIAIRYGMRFAPYLSYVKQLPFSLQVLVMDSHQKYNQQQSLPRLPINWEGKNHHKKNLQNAILREGILKDTILRQAQLQKTDLTGADLTGADLRGANLRKAILTDATLKGADLTDADLRGVVMFDETADPKKQKEQKANFRDQLTQAILCRTALPHNMNEGEDLNEQAEDLNEQAEDLNEQAKDRDCLETGNTVILRYPSK